MMPNAYVAKELIYLIIESDAEIMAKSHWTKDLMYDFPLEYSQGCYMSA